MQNDTKAKFYLLIPSAGVGARVGGDVPKQHQLVAGRSVLEHTLAALEQLNPVRVPSGVLVLAPEDLHWKTCWSQAVASHKLGRFHIAPVGGARRSDTVAAGLAWLREQGAQDQDWVLVHDAARCLVQPTWIERLIDVCLAQNEAVGALLAVPLSDTLKTSTQSAFSTETLSRSDKWLAQTPQCFPLGLLERALHKAVEDGVEITDEASAVERLGVQPQLVLGHSHNIKITYPEDFALASAIMQSRQNTAAPSEKSSSVSAPSLNLGFNLRIGEGWDTHQLVDAAATGRKLILGGVEIAHDKALLGHSDADVLLHAITDALLGAAGLGDIGRHFPDTDDQYQGADSKILLQTAYASVQAAGYRLQNLDATIIAQAPKLMPHMEAIRVSVAQCLGVESTQVNIKAKTAEKLGPVGEGLSMEARAVVLLLGVAKG